MPYRSLLPTCVLLGILSVQVDAQMPVQASCTIDGERARCGSIVVHENHADPQSRKLTLRALVFPRTGSGSALDPIFVLAGGPGQAATALAEWASHAFGTARHSRDIVLIDQRGSGGTNRLTCPVALRSFVVPADVSGCIERVSRTANLAFYGTESFVEDLEVARKALGYDRIVLYGASYGTRAAYAYARRYPVSTSGVVLLAPAPISMTLIDSFEVDSRRALDLLALDCLADRACKDAFPRLREDIEQFRSNVTDRYFTVGLAFLQYSTATAAHIPMLMSRAARGDLAQLDAAITASRAQLETDIALGLHLTIICGEDLPLSDSARQSAARQQYEQACRNWPTLRPSAGFHDAVRVPVPALVLVGDWDPVTSPRWARIAAEQFAPSELVLLPRTAHMPVGAASCISALISQFLDSGKIDTSCASGISRPAYRVR